MFTTSGDDLYAQRRNRQRPFPIRPAYYISLRPWRYNADARSANAVINTHRTRWAFANFAHRDLTDRMYGESRIRITGRNYQALTGSYFALAKRRQIHICDTL